MSRYATSEDAYSRYAPSSPMSYAGEEAQPSDPDVKPMRLKVLYTTDDKTNCMARWSKVIYVRTAFLDEKTEIGVVELRKCIKAIVSSSPELVAKLGHDYTVYAYDYSEYETPLVGQGMLSWVLASSSAPGAASSPSGSMVTGRVVKNGNALFGMDTVAQILEVKLRLVPVPTILQSEYIDSMKRYRDISRVMPEGFDPQGWTDFLNANPHVLSMIGITGSVSPHAKPESAAGLQNVQRLMQQSQQYSANNQFSQSRRESFAESVVSRDGSPTPSIQSPYPEALRPASRESGRELRRTASTGQIPGLEDDNEDTLDEGPARKRARITQIKRPRKNAGFGNQADSLRVAASTANSVRVLQPTAIRPGLDRTTSLEEPPRVPTPVPQMAHNPRRSAVQPRSGLSRYASASDQYAMTNEMIATPQSSVTSPGAGSVLESSPGEDPGSSPPMPTNNPHMVAPSSPQLPRMPLHEDSGFMSGAIDDDSEFVAKNAQRTMDTSSSVHQDPGVGKAYTQTRQRKSAPKLTRADSAAAQMTAEERAAELSRKNALRAIGWRRIQSFSEGQAAATNRAVVASDAKPARAARQDRPKSKNAYDKEKQRERLGNRLQNAVDAGERPPMCENCGSLDSSTWRKAFQKKHSGAPTDVRTGRGPGAIRTVVVEEKNEQGEVTVFSIIKKSLAANDEGFEEMLLCNPCGLWLGSKGNMRPPDVWKQQKQTRSKLKDTILSYTSNIAKSQEYEKASQSAVPLPSEFTEPPSEAPQSCQPPQSEAGGEREDSYRNGSALREADNEPELPTLPEAGQLHQGAPTRGRSDSEIPANAVAALQRAVRSSPGQTRGSKQSPIDVDTTPDKTRRSLFPSPKTKGPLGVSAGNKDSALRDSPDAPKQRKFDMQQAPSISLGDAADKENLMPPPPSKRTLSDSHSRTTPTPDLGDEHDFFADFFRDGNGPATPSRVGSGGVGGITLPLPKSPSNAALTPTKTTTPQKAGANTFFSSAEKAFLHGNPPGTPTAAVRTPSRMTARNTPGSSATDTPFTRQLKNLFSTEPSAFDIDTSPSKVFGDLPMIGDDFAEWPMTTDMPMPSSPPIGRLASSLLLKTPGAKDATADDDSPSWDELGLGKTPGMPSAARTRDADASV